jgi:hypothetical protein
LLPEQAAWRKLQRRMIRKFLTPIYRAWLREALLSGALQVDSFDPSEVRSVDVAPPLVRVDRPAQGRGSGRHEGRHGHPDADPHRERERRRLHAIIDERADEIEYAKSKGVPLFVGGIDVTGKFAAAPWQGRRHRDGDNGNGATSRRSRRPPRARPLRDNWPEAVNE